MATPSIRNSHVQPNAIRWVEGDTLPTIEEHGVAMPLLVDSVTGRLKVDTKASISADLTLIESKMDTANGIATGAAADTAAIKTQLATGSIAVTGGGGSGGASAAYNATLPTYTSGASSTLQTDVNGRLITTGTLTDTQLRASAVPVSLASVPSHPVTNAGTFAVQPSAGDLTSGSAKTQIINGANTLAVDSSGAITAANPASQTVTYNFTGAVAVNTVVIPSTSISAFRNISVADVAVGSGGQIQFQFSNDNTNWIPISFTRADGSTSYSPSSNLYAYTNLSAWTSPTYGFMYFRMIVIGAVTSGTTTLIVSLSNSPASFPVLQTVMTNTPQVYPNITSGTQGFYNFHTLVSAAGTNSTTISGQKNIGTIWLSNTTASWRYIKIYNAITFTVGTTTPNFNIGIPPNSTIDLSTSFISMRFGTAFSYALTGGSALLDSTAISAGDVLVNVSYF